MRKIWKFITLYPIPWILVLIASIPRAYNGEWVIFTTIHTFTFFLYLMFFLYFKLMKSWNRY